MKNKKIVSLLLVGIYSCTACISFLPEMDHERCCCRSSQVINETCGVIRRFR